MQRYKTDLIAPSPNFHYETLSRGRGKFVKRTAWGNGWNYRMQHQTSCCFTYYKECIHILLQHKCVAFLSTSAQNQLTSQSFCLLSHHGDDDNNTTLLKNCVDSADLSTEVSMKLTHGTEHAASVSCLHLQPVLL